MVIKEFVQEGSQIILHTDGEICNEKRELLHSKGFEVVINLFIDNLRNYDSPLLHSIGLELNTKNDRNKLINILRTICEYPLDQIADILPQNDYLLQPSHRRELLRFVEMLYDFWRSFSRFMVLHSQSGSSSFDQRPYRIFNETLEALTHLVRSVYRDTCENITGKHPRIYRQVAAGCNVGIIVVPMKTVFSDEYQNILGKVPFIRQVWIDPPLIIDPPMNTRTGQFQKVDKNPLLGLSLKTERWVCYPAKVGNLIIFVYFHQHFMNLGCSLTNLFELATDEQIEAGPDALYLYGVPSSHLSDFGDLPTIFYDDIKNNIMVAAVPQEDRFGYFGYIKKMILTLHNIIMMKRGLMPYHGAMVHLLFRNNQAATILLIGDTAAGKSETLEAFRSLGKESIREMRIIADDMGSIERVDDERVIGYGTEIGAFIRLDDLQHGYAFGQIDRSIIMSPHKTNARVVLPVTTIDEITCGYPIDYVFYANNYDVVDENHPVIEQIHTFSEALKIFREGAVMAKGTTTAKGLVHSYFANIFGPPQYKDLHEELAIKTFQTIFNAGVFVGQMRTRLGIPGYETKGPEEAARALLNIISGEKREN
ncbi:MAG: hypothetical protein MRJ65_05120 [Candidatus Brocadiaceae bacterium]|nr:hypothetical protein [Candidatus Brocadiaceae bacterium]